MGATKPFWGCSETIPKRRTTEKWLRIFVYIKKKIYTFFLCIFFLYTFIFGGKIYTLCIRNIHKKKLWVPPSKIFVSKAIALKIKNRLKGYMNLIVWTGVSHNSLSELQEVCLKRHRNWKAVSKIMQISAKITHFSIPFFWNCPISKRSHWTTLGPRFAPRFGRRTVWMFDMIIFKSIWISRAFFLVYGELFRSH